MSSPQSATPDEPLRRYDRAIKSLRAGRPILVHDAVDREGETDVFCPAHAVTPEIISRLRNDAGGLICVAIPDAIADRFGLPYYADAIDHPAASNHDLGYDDRSSFSVTVNHRDTYTGITDNDRALTIRRLGDAAAQPGTFDFAEEFRIPGHVNLLRAASGLLDEREGHTEFGVALATVAEIPQAMVVCEMLDDETGEALAPDQARSYADRHSLVYLEGDDVIDDLR